MSNGLFLKPMVVVDVKQEIKIVTEETFGPVLPVIPFDTEEKQFAWQMTRCIS